MLTCDERCILYPSCAKGFNVVIFLHMGPAGFEPAFVLVKSQGQSNFAKDPSVTRYNLLRFFLLKLVLLHINTL